MTEHEFRFLSPATAVADSDNLRVGCVRLNDPLVSGQGLLAEPVKGFQPSAASAVQAVAPRCGRWK